MSRTQRGWSMTLRYLTFLLGLFVMSIGIALSVYALIGTTPISAIPLVLSYATPWSLGAYTVGINVVLLIAQILLLRRRFELIQLLQVPAAFVFGAACDFSVWLLRGLDGVAEGNYAIQMGLSLAGSVVLGIGVWLQVTPRVLTLAGDGISVALATVTKRPFSTVKIMVDSTLVAIAVILSLVLLSGLNGVREGTVIAAVLVGYVVRLLQRHVPWPAVLSPSPPAASEAKKSSPEQ
ncbi:MAG: YczE/YyaS/YitT family protein [Gulosibacter sp.]|uniref:YczE/YyaS/YitT family protein n=1 Tax=Gulosibacter sp. TaxID=2817531 RepID=UPI003F92BFEB